MEAKILKKTRLSGGSFKGTPVILNEVKNLIALSHQAFKAKLEFMGAREPSPCSRILPVFFKKRLAN